MSFSIFGIAVPAWIFAICCATIFAWELARLWLALSSEWWPSVDGEILEARIENRPDSDGDDFYVPILSYSYKVAGEIYRGKRLLFHPKGSYDYEDVSKAMVGVVAGSIHRVHFHPRYVRLCVLKPGAGVGNYVLLGFLFVVAVAAMFAQVFGEP